MITIAIKIHVALIVIITRVLKGSMIITPQSVNQES